jgi:hypothetical protein
MIYLKPDKNGRPRKLTRQEQERLAYKRRLWFVKRKYDNFIGMETYVIHIVAIKQSDYQLEKNFGLQ